MATKIKPKPDIPDYIPLAKLRRFVESTKDQPGSTKLTFEFMMTLCFPSVYGSMRDWGARQFIEGYQAAEKDLKDESSRHSI